MVRALLVLMFMVGACTKQSSNQPTDVKSLSAEQLKSRGQQVYMANCASCHNPSNPGQDGSVGPAVADSSLELIKARVIGKTYPPGYKPKRSTTVMPNFPHLAPEAEALEAFLNSK